MLWPQKEPAERKVAHRDWAPVSFISRNPGQLGDSLNETKFSPSKTILPQEHECLIRGAFQFAPSHSIATTFLLDPYYVTHPITNDAAIQPHRSEYLRSLPTLKGFDSRLSTDEQVHASSTESLPWFCHLHSLLLTGGTRHDRQINN